MNDERQRRLRDKIGADARVSVLADLPGGRLVIEIPLDLIKTHSELRKLRGGDDIDAKLLTDSVKRTGKDTLYPISLLAQENEQQEIVYYCGDGAQRLKALIANAAEKTAAQVILRWRDDRDAMEDCLTANVARYSWSDADIFSVIRTGKMPSAKLKEITGFSDSTLERYEAVAPHEWLTKMVDQKCLGYAKAAKLITACKKNADKIAAVKNSLLELFAKAQESAEHYCNEEKRSGLAERDKKKKKVDHWFKSYSKQLDQIQSVLDDDGAIERNADGQPRIVLDPNESGRKLGAYIGPEDEWKKTLALSNFFERDADDVPLDSYEMILNRWDSIRRNIEWHRDRLRDKQYREDRPMPLMADKLAEPGSSVPPVPQSPDSEIIES